MASPVTDSPLIDVSTKEAWDEAWEKNEWIESFLKGKTVACGKKGSVWKIEAKLAEEKYFEFDDCDGAYATAVYSATALSGPCKGRQEVLKVHMQ